jgi:hypothetical protein
MPQRIDITGNRYGMLVVEKFAYSKNRKSYWKVKCDCGNEKIVYGGSLKNGDTQSCGCLGKRHRIESIIRHGKTGTAIYRTWVNMKARCNIKSSSRYSCYGARGITVCEEWNNSFEAFYNYVSQLPHFNEEGYTLDRINVNSNYEPDNIRWATKKDQMNNYRRNHLITYNGKTQTLGQWADELNINRGTLLSRLNNAHWSIERSLTEIPFKGKNQTYKKRGDC